MNKFQKRIEQMGSEGKRINFVNPDGIRKLLLPIQAKYIQIYKEYISLDKVVILAIEKGAWPLLKEMEDIHKNMNE